jgi:DNA processing protein
MPTLADAVALSLTPFSWRRDLGQRLRSGDAPGAILAALAPSSPDARATFARLPARAALALRRAARERIEPLAWGDSDYPALLAQIYDPPPVLWLRGSRRTFGPPAVAIVGSRAGSSYALAAAERLAGDLAARGVAIVSGLARGVDSAAHRGALAAGGPTLAVLGSGLDVIYPTEHVALAGRITEAGAVISELAPGTRPHRWFFPLRNRIISGLSRAVVVVEAGEKSGSLITARCALEQGRDVLAVPGSIFGERNRGGHALIRDGAKIVESANDILDELDLRSSKPWPMQRASEKGESDQNGRASDPILDAMPPGEGCDLEAISARSGLPIARLLTGLLELELQGLVRRAGGGRFVRLVRSC